MRLLPLALIVALLGPSAAAAQSPAQQRMLDAAAQMRANVEKLKGTLTPETRAEMLRQADQLEKSVAGGAYAGEAPKEPTLADKIAAAHGGRLEWLTGEAACAGYTHDNYSTFRFSPAINERDTHCRNAFGHWATHARFARDPNGAEGAEQALFYYDAAARRAVEFYGRK